jgi:Xaa-Pro aminopeptidase
MKTTKSKLAALRAAMQSQKLQGYVVPRQDEFQGEYVAAYAERLKWLSGFAGSWGLAIVAQAKAAIFVDGRYTTQVKEQVDTKLFAPQHLVDAPPTAWIEANFKKGQRLGFDPMLTTVADAKRLSAACQKVGAVLVAIEKNLIDVIWTDQPARSQQPLSVQPLKFAGIAAKAKLTTLAKAMKQDGIAATIITEPSSVAWVLNLRGSDVPRTPVVLAFAIIHQTGKAELFIDPARLPADVKAALKSIAVVRKPTELKAALKALANKKVAIDEGSAPDHIRAVLAKAKAKIVAGQDPCTLPKAQKNKVEQQGARDAQLRDGAALSKFLHWLSVEAPKGNLNEADAATKLHEFRKDTKLLLDLSFDTISAAGPNAAIPHYHLDPSHCLKIKNNSIFLIDSGGQYRDGTTDVTRTVVVGKPTDEMKDRFTRVLKGMIALSRLRFPRGSTGAHIDALARASLWAAGLDFDHGTGHGVGSYLSVHEGPARISKASHVALQPGMIMSNEPGYYKPGHYGIRIENLLIVEAATSIQGGERPMMGFETLTLAPIDRNLIAQHLLTRDELHWLDEYHARVFKEIGPQLTGAAFAWMKEVCAKLG